MTYDRQTFNYWTSALLIILWLTHLPLWPPAPTLLLSLGWYFFLILSFCLWPSRVRRWGGWEGVPLHTKSNEVFFCWSVSSQFNSKTRQKNPEGERKVFFLSDICSHLQGLGSSNQIRHPENWVKILEIPLKSGDSTRQRLQVWAQLHRFQNQVHPLQTVES